MKENLRRLRLLILIFPCELFYNISVSEYDIKLQGKISTKIIQKANKLGFKYDTYDDGYICLIRGIYKLILTD